MKYLEEFPANFFLLLLRILPLSFHARMTVSWLSPSCPMFYTCTPFPSDRQLAQDRAAFPSGLSATKWLAYAIIHGCPGDGFEGSERNEAMPWLLTVKGVHGDQVQVETFL